MLPGIVLLRQLGSSRASLGPSDLVVVGEEDVKICLNHLRGSGLTR